MSSYQCLWHCVGRVLAWVTLLFAVGTGCGQPLHGGFLFLVVEVTASGRLWPFSALRNNVFQIDRMAAHGESGHTGER